MEHLLLNGYGTDSVYDAYKLFEVEYRKEFSEDTDQLYFPKVPSVVLNFLPHYAIEWREKDRLNRVLYTEIAGAVPIGVANVHFKMDSIILDEDSLYFSMEHKTGSRLSRSWIDQWKLKFQVGTYTHVMNCLYPSESIWGVVINGAILTSGLKKAGNVQFERVPIRRQLAQMEDWLFEAQKWVLDIQKDTNLLINDFEWLVGQPTMQCFLKRTCSCTNYSGCEFIDYCISWPNPLQSWDDLPLGYHIRHWDPVEEEKNAKLVIDFSREGGDKNE
jgi:hypothetical protein